MTRTSQRGLRGYTILIAVSITALVFTAVIGLSAVVLLTLKGGANVRAANSAFFAAEGGVERALYAMAGHGPGFETVTAADSDPDPGCINLASRTTPFLRPVFSAGRSQYGYVVRARTDALFMSGAGGSPCDEGGDVATAEPSLEIAAHSSVTIPLSIDDDSDPVVDEPDPTFVISAGDLVLQVAEVPGAPIEPDAPADYRINTWKGPADTECFFQANPTAACPGHEAPDVVEPDDDDVGGELTPFLFASVACSDAVCSDTWSWRANPATFAPLDEIDADRLLIFRDVDDLLGPGEGGTVWSSADTYLIGHEGAPIGTPRGWPLSAYSGEPVPTVGAQMLDTTGTWIGTAPLPLIHIDDPTRVHYVGTGGTIPGTLSASGPATNQTAPDDYLYVDANTCLEGEITPCTGAPDGRVSAPWHLEITFSKVDSDEKLQRRVLFDPASDGRLPLETLFNGRYNGSNGTPTLDSFLNAGGDVRMSISTNGRPLRIGLVMNNSGDLTAPDEKTVINVLGTNGASRQTLRTTVYQEETLPVFRKTTVF